VTFDELGEIAAMVGNRKRLPAAARTGAFRLRLRGLFLGAAMCVAGENGIAQEPPSRPVRIGHLELVAGLMGDQPAGVAVGKSGRLFVTFPRHDGDVAFTVGEVRDGKALAYPSVDLNHAMVDRTSDTFFSVQTLQVDASDHLWMLDTGTLQFGEPPVPGAPKLVEVDLGSDRVVRVIPIPSEALVATSALKDFRLDFHRGKAGTIYITDSAPGREALLVLDISSGRVMRRLAGNPALSTQGNTPIVGFEPLLASPTEPTTNSHPKPWLAGLNAVELSADRKTLYFSSFTGCHLYSVSAADLANPAVSDRHPQLVDEGSIGMAGHFALDSDGRLYFMDMEQNAIYRRTVDGLIQLVVADPRLMWPDTMAIGPDGHLYVTTSQHDRRAEFHHGEDLRQKPYGLFKVFIGSGPVRAGEG
jgi:sugar lactone lactonase YvrE